MFTLSRTTQQRHAPTRRPRRGIALVFVLTGIIGLCVTVLALRSRPYRELSGQYAGRLELATAS